jgi:signal transduction histidine kinase
MILEKINHYATQKVSQFGAQYTAFSIFGIINYPLAYFFELYYVGHVETDNLILRFIATLLCFCLYSLNKSKSKFKQLLPLFWYFTVIVSIPLLASYMLLKHNFSMSWLINFNVGILITILLFDWLSFIYIEIVGIALGVAIYGSLNGIPNTFPEAENLGLFLYLFFCIIILAPIFSRNKELFNLNNIKLKDNINKELERQVEERTFELNKALAVKTEFLNNISHEIRAPISAFSIAADTLANDWNKIDNTKRYALAKLVAQAANRIRNLSMHLINATKFQNSTSSLNLQKINLTSLINDFIDEAETLYLKDKKIKIKFNCKQVYFVNGDYEALGQVIRNIVINAIKFSPDKSIITIHLKRNNGVIKVTTSDEGVGIPENELEKIFSYFYQSSRTKTGAGGVGLGLHLAKQIIEAHRGKIWAKNNEIGASFIFTLNEFITKDSTASKHQKTIIVIDDEESMINSIKLGLASKTQIQVMAALSGVEGLELLKSINQKIDLIVLDIMMPGMNGIETLKIIKQEWPKLKVIMHSGIATTAERNEALELGAHAFLAKPYTIDKLIELL